MKSYVELNNGIQMPAVGLGTFLMAPPDAEEAVYNALKVGYRLIDTANAYLHHPTRRLGMVSLATKQL